MSRRAGIDRLAFAPHGRTPLGGQLEYYEYDPATIDQYNPLFQRLHDRQGRRSIRPIAAIASSSSFVVTEAEVTAERLSGEEVIGLAGRLERLVAQQRQGIEHLAPAPGTSNHHGLRIH